MKSKLLISLISISLILMSCGSKKYFVKIENGKIIDKRLVGIWKGNESGNFIKGMSSEWIMTRNLDGTFSLNVKATMDNETIEQTENGNWWIENGLFHEFHDISRETDIYYYEVLNEKQIKFKAEKMFVDLVNENYEFIDSKVTE